MAQRCLIHRARNLLAKVPAHAQAEVKTAYWAIFDMPDDVPAGPRAEALAQQRIQAFAATYAKTYPAAVRCLLDDAQALTVYLRFPAEHWHRIRHSNFIERTFGETRRRVKVIGRLPGETSCGSLWAVLDRASRGWRGFNITTAGTRLLQDLRRQLFDPPTPIRRHAKQVHQPAADAASHRPPRSPRLVAIYTAPGTPPLALVPTGNRLEPVTDGGSQPYRLGEKRWHVNRSTMRGSLIMPDFQSYLCELSRLKGWTS